VLVVAAAVVVRQSKGGADGGDGSGGCGGAGGGGDGGGGDRAVKFSRHTVSPAAAERQHDDSATTEIQLARELADQSTTRVLATSQPSTAAAVGTESERTTSRKMTPHANDTATLMA
jgi:hypothetical protein